MEHEDIFENDDPVVLVIGDGEFELFIRDTMMKSIEQLDENISKVSHFLQTMRVNIYDFLYKVDDAYMEYINDLRRKHEVKFINLKIGKKSDICMKTQVVNNVRYNKKVIPKFVPP